MNTNDLAFLWNDSQEKQLEINGNTIRVYPSNFGPGRNFANGVEFEAALIKALSPSATNLITVSCSPGDYESVSFPNANSYITYITENTALTTGLATGNDGYSITGNTLEVTSVGGAGDRFASVEDAYNAVAVDNLLGVPERKSVKIVEYFGFDAAKTEGHLGPFVIYDEIVRNQNYPHNLTVGDYVKITYWGGNTTYNKVYQVEDVVNVNAFRVGPIPNGGVYVVRQAVVQTSNPYVGVVVDHSALNLVVL